YRYFRPTPARPAPAELKTLTPPTGSFGEPVGTDTPYGQTVTCSITGVLPDTEYTLSFRTTPGLTLGISRVVARVQIPTGTASKGADVEVVDGAAASGDPASAPVVQSDVLYLGYVDRPNDLDLFGYQSTPLTQVGGRLSHLAGEGDLAVYGPEAES